MITRLVFVRHGQSESNAGRFYGGRLNVNLTELGRAQAEETARYLKDIHIDAAYSSDYVRTIQTAKPILRGRDVPLAPHLGLREINGGAWEGMAYSEIEERYPVERGIWHKNIMGMVCPGGDSANDVFIRAMGAIRDILKDNEGKTVLVSAHATIIRVLLTHFHGIDLRAINDVPWSPNASVTIVDCHDDGHFEIVLESYDEHLKSAGLA